MQIKSADRPPRSLANAILNGDQHGRAGSLLHDARGNDADHSRMPAVLIQHVRVAITHVGLLDLTHRLIENDLVEFLPGAVEFLQLASNRVGLIVPLAEQQLQPTLGIGDAASGVETRRQHKTHATRRQRLALES